MEQNNLKKGAGFLSEIGIVLRRDGYDTSVPDNGLLPVLVDRLPLCRISETGSVRYRDADIGSVEREDALHEVTQTAETVSEYMKLMDAAPLLKAQGLDETYRLLADFNGVVLAGHPSRLGVQFVTWDWDYERTGVSQGIICRTITKRLRRTSPCAAALFGSNSSSHRSTSQKYIDAFRIRWIILMISPMTGKNALAKYRSKSQISCLICSSGLHKRSRRRNLHSQSQLCKIN
jgi:hypothetical protein